MVQKEFALPDVGEGVAEGELITWLVEPGDYVEEDQPIVEVETDKALVEIPSPYDGEVVERRAREGDVVPVDAVFVVFEVAEGDANGTADDSAAETTTDDGSDTRSVSPSDSDSDESDAVVARSAVPEGRVFAPPSVRRLARERGVDLTAVHPDSGRRRLTERDVREAAGEPVATEPSFESADGASTVPGEATTEPLSAANDGDGDSRDSTPDEISGAPEPTADRERTLAMPATRRLAREEGLSIDAVPANEQRDGDPYVTPEDVQTYADAARTPSPKPPVSEPRSAELSGESAGPHPGDRVPYTGVRRTIGDQMATSKYTAPHVSHHDEVEVADLVDARSRLKERAEARGVKLTYMPFAVKAVVAALKQLPSVNAELDEDQGEILLHNEYNIGIAVASDAGLMVPVIDDADRKGLLELAHEINDKAERARNRTIDLEEMQGGTFTITNVGAIGGEYASPIINYPEAGILALGSLKERPWAEDGEVVARPTLPISMSVDHRIVDGAEAAQFTNEVKRYLNTPELLLLE